MAHWTMRSNVGDGRLTNDIVMSVPRQPGWTEPELDLPNFPHSVALIKFIVLNLSNEQPRVLLFFPLCSSTLVGLGTR